VQAGTLLEGNDEAAVLQSSLCHGAFVVVEISEPQVQPSQVSPEIAEVGRRDGRVLTEPHIGGL